MGRGPIPRQELFEKSPCTPKTFIGRKRGFRLRKGMRLPFLRHDGNLRHVGHGGLWDATICGAPPHTPIKKLFEKSFLIIFQNLDRPQTAFWAKYGKRDLGSQAGIAIQTPPRSVRKTKFSAVQGS
jgi:hypothetical protein